MSSLKCFKCASLAVSMSPCTLADAGWLHWCEQGREETDEVVEPLCHGAQVSTWYCMHAWLLHWLLHTAVSARCHSYCSLNPCRLIAEKQVPTASLLFAKKYREKLIEERIDRNYLSHLTSLYDFGLIPSTTIKQCMSAIYDSPES